MPILVAVRTTYAINEDDLSEYRRQKAARFQREGDRIRCLCAGVALDYALQTIGLREKTVAVAFGEHGKPYLVEYPEWHFNLSHSGEWSVCALSDTPIGVDVEEYRPQNYLALAERFFSPAEQVQLQKCQETERQTLFFRLWTQKESLLKVAGIGLSALSDSESVSKEGYVYRSYELSGYALTVCTKGEFPSALTIIE